ncbi:MAG: metallophosphoesterase [Oscillospiraceae bacterium]
MIYVTSDLHGDTDRLKQRDVKKLKKSDTLIVLGDFGFLWSGGKKEEKMLKKLGKTRYQLCFIDGCHENFDLLKEYPIEQYKGGNARVLGKNLRYLMRGEVFTIDDKRLFVLGGGESRDKDDRTEGTNWWRAELPKADELDKCEENLATVNWQVDYILTHDAPAKLLMFIDMSLNEFNWFEAFLDSIMKRCTYKRWLFGKYHMDKTISSKASAVYRGIVPLND